MPTSPVIGTAVVSAEVRRQEILDRLADHVLAHGLEASSLRPLAAAAGTSDRMLLYYFADKAAQLAAVLEHATQRLADALARSAPAAPQPYNELLNTIWKIVGGKALRPYMRLWLDIAARAARDEPPYKAVGGQIAQSFLGWIGSLLAVGNAQLRGVQAARLLLHIEGLLVLEAVGLDDVIDMTLQPMQPPPAQQRSASRGTSRKRR